MSLYDVYHQQYGGGGRGVSNVFIGAQRQRGHGLGSFFTGLFRSALPFLAKGARAVGKEALRAGANILDDIGENKMTFKESLKNRMNESGQNLKRKAVDKINKMMEGSGYKTLSRKRRAQSRGVSASRRLNLNSRKKRGKARKRLSVKRGRVDKKTRRRNSKSKRGKRKTKNKTQKIKPLDIFG